MSSTSITLHIANALPARNATESARTIALWKQISGFFHDRPFKAAPSVRALENTFRVSLDSSSLLQRMEQSVEATGSFEKHAGLDASLTLTISDAEALSLDERFGLATVFFQQLVLAANLCLPGSIQLLGTSFRGDGAQAYEAQIFDSHILYGALKAAQYNEWPLVRTLSFEDVWRWLERCGTSCAHTALDDINKTLFTLLKVAEQRLEYSARTVLLVIYQLELLMACRLPGFQDRLGARLRMVLGKMPESADCIRELQEVRNNLFVGTQPVHRPPLICHSSAESQREQLGQHNSAVESGSAIVIALIQDLILHNAQTYEFDEVWERR